jgi:hypothetical protein
VNADAEFAEPRGEGVVGVPGPVIREPRPGRYREEEGQDSSRERLAMEKSWLSHATPRVTGRVR